MATRIFLTFSLLLLCVCADLHAQTTQIVYLSGTDKDHTVNWEFFINTGQKSGSWNKIPVPSNWELQGFGTYNYFQDTKNPEEQGLYKHHFSADAAWSRKKVFIVFEGAMTDTKVMINGQLAGPVHQGGYYRFKYDISDLLKTGDNLLEVAVSKKSANASINLAERRADFWQFGGIYRPVYLEILPTNYIDHIAVDAKMDGGIRVEVYAPTVKHDNSITAELETLDGQQIGSEIVGKAGNGEFPVTLRGSYKTIVPWNPEFPTLYKLMVSIKDKDGRVIHTIVQRIGFRTMELRLHDGIYVNGKKVILKGVCRHSEWPESGRTLSKAISIMDVKLMKEMNMNAVRMSHYPPDQHFLDVCDSLGLFVLDELTGWQNKYDTAVGKKLVKEMVERDVNHPAIIFWDNGNEGGWNTALDDQFKLYDPQNRVVLHPWEKFNGTDTRHYPDYNYVVNSALYGNDVFFPTEFMHGNYDGGAGAGLEDFWNAILGHPYGAGGFIWVFADGGIRRVDQDSTMDTSNDSAPDGILGPHREKEGSFYTIKELWSPVVIKRKLITPGFDGRIAVENRYSYTNLNECQFKWRLVSFPGAGDTGTTAITGAQDDLPKFDLAPGEKGFLQLNLPQNWASYDALYLTAIDPYGRELFTWSWPIQLPDQVKKPVVVSSAPAITAVDSATSLIVHSSGIAYFFDKVTGQLERVVNSKHEISLSGPVEAGFTHQLVKLNSYVDGANYIVEPVYAGDTYFTVKWTFAPGKAVALQYQYTLEKRWSQQTGVDFAGICFRYPEDKITGMKWLGRGPYRVWKNRLKGQQFGVWHKNYNNTITGANWNYPEFKGYHADLYWVVIENKESPFTVYTDDQSIFFQMLKPDHSKYEHESLKAAFPDGDIGFLNSISPIGTRFQVPALLGPESQKNIQLNYGIVKGTLWFDFRMSPDEERKAAQSRIEAASRVDWQNMMNMLALRTPVLVPQMEDSTRPPNLTQKVAGSGYWFDSAGSQITRTMWGNWTNYDENKANHYVLPDPLKLKNGKPVNKVSVWWKERRPEILADYENEIYGHMPVNLPKVTYEVTLVDTNARDGQAIMKTIVGHIDNSAYPDATPTIVITLYLPKHTVGKLPLIVTVGGFLGRFPGSKSTAPTALDLVLAKGWAIATVTTGALQADNGAGFKTGIIGLMNKGNLRKPDEWGVFSAWCWGLSRALDYLITEPLIDAKKVGIEGHSRWGKTALLATALDSRWAICYASCAGSMGSALEKRDYGENINDVAQPGEYHWMAGNFLKYAGNWQNMPVDAHELIALVAPRPLFITGGTQDLWADPKGEFLACVAASPVYELLGKKGISVTEMPPPDTALIDGDLAFREHIGGHSDLHDWPMFISFAERYFDKK